MTNYSKSLGREAIQESSPDFNTSLPPPCIWVRPDTFYNFPLLEQLPTVFPDEVRVDVAAPDESRVGVCVVAAVLEGESPGGGRQR